MLALVGMAGCKRQEPKAVAEPAPTQADRSPATQQTQPVPNLAATDFVIHPQVDPAEQTAGPRRIISMAPNLTELVWSLGLGDRLVGRTQYCLYPPQVAKVEVVGALLDPNLERILGLQPDLLLVTNSSTALREKFQALNLPMHVLPDNSLDDIFQAIDQLGRLTGRPRTAATLAQNLRAELATLQQTAKIMAGRQQAKAVFVTGALPDPPTNVWVAGRGGNLDAMLSMAGVRNVVGQVANRPWFEITPEQVVWQQPDVIIEVRESGQMAQRDEAAAAWRKLPGLEKTRIVTLDDPAMLVPGPRENVMLAKLIHGLCGNAD